MGGGIVKFELVNYIYLSKNQKERLRNLRNLPQIKQNLYNQHFITKQEHKNFIKNLNKNPKKMYFSVFLQYEILGSINFIFNEKYLEWGFYANPFLKVAGLGRVFEQIGIFYAFNVLRVKTLYCEVFEKNQAVLNLHKKFSFKQRETKEFGNEKIILLSLGTDTWN